MSKKTKTAAAEKRKKAKRAKKAAEKARYQAYRDSGSNKKSKRNRQTTKDSAHKKIRTVSHAQGKCGNPGCVKCFAVNFAPFLRKGMPRGMPNWMWKKWTEGVPF